MPRCRPCSTAHPPLTLPVLRGVEALLWKHRIGTRTNEAPPIGVPKQAAFPKCGPRFKARSPIQRPEAPYIGSCSPMPRSSPGRPASVRRVSRGPVDQVAGRPGELGGGKARTNRSTDGASFGALNRGAGGLWKGALNRGPHLRKSRLLRDLDSYPIRCFVRVPIRCFHNL